MIRIKIMTQKPINGVGTTFGTFPDNADRVTYTIKGLRQFRNMYYGLRTYT
jgi:hypothetical protein